MCGICGFCVVSPDQHAGQEMLTRMVATLGHRGPDDRGNYINGPAALGHTRLSIIDLTGGHQPLFNEDRSIAVICNGEIYNFRELREQLQDLGHRFATGSDSEVIVHLWEQYGREGVKHLRGMFAYVLYDAKHDVLFGARDRFGQKPLFYTHAQSRFGFASEIKALLTLPWVSREINLKALDQFFFYQFIPVPGTPFQHICQLPPGHYFELHEGTLTIAPYWQPSFNRGTQRSDADHLRALELAIDDAVASHLVSDVPVGVFLSGGLDSSYITAVTSKRYPEKLQSFSISFPDERYDEAPYARKVSQHFGTTHYEFAFEPAHLPTVMEQVITNFDQPLADPAALPLWYLSKHAANIVKVVLTGDGGDEIFAGYPKYQLACKPFRLAGWLYSRRLVLNTVAEMARCARDPAGLRKLVSRLALACAPEFRVLYSKDFWEGWQRHALYGERLRAALSEVFELAVSSPLPTMAGLTPLNAMLWLDQKAYLPGDLLLKTDYTTMAHGLEARAPLLDHRLADIAAALPGHLKATRSQTKVALRHLATRLLPAELVTRPKHGFSVPLKNWFRNELNAWIQEILLGSSTTVPLYFRADTVKRVLHEHMSGRYNHSKRIYSLLVFELWHRRYCA